MTQEVQDTLRRFNAEMHRLNAEGRGPEYSALVRCAAEYAREQLSADDPDLGAMLMNLADVERGEGRYQEGAAACEAAANVFAAALGPASGECVLALNNWGELLSKSGDPAGAALLFKQAAKLARHAGLDQHFATARNNLGFLDAAAGKYRSAERKFRDALRVRRRIFGKQHPETANSLNNLGDLFLRLADYRRAGKMFREALVIRTSIAGADARLRGYSLNNMAALHAKLGDYAAAEEFFGQALRLLAPSTSEPALEWAAVADNYGALLGAMGRFEEAETLARDALKVRKRVLPASHPDFAVGLSNLGKLRFAAGDYAAALRLHNGATAHRREALGNPLDLAASLSALVEVYCAIGDYATAEPLCNQALDIRVEHLGDGHPDSVVSFVDLAAVRAAQGDFEGARTLLERVVARRRELFGGGHPDVAAALSTLAALLVNNGRGAQAEPLLLETLEIRRQRLGVRHPDVGRTRVKLGALAYESGQWKAAGDQLQVALEILSSQLGSDHPSVTDVLHRLAAVDAATGDPDAALSRIIEATVREDAMLDTLLSFGSERQRIALLDTMRRGLHRLLSLVLTYFRDSPVAVEAVTNCVLRRKGLALTAAAAQRALEHGTPGEELQSLLREQIAAEARITQALLQGPRGTTAEAHRAMVAEWIANKEAIESRIAERAPGIVTFNSKDFGFADVARALPSGAMLCEFVRFPMFDFSPSSSGATRTREPRYAALLLPAGSGGTVRILDLGLAHPIDTAIGQFRASLIGGSETSRDLRRADSASLKAHSGSEVRALVFDPLTEASPGIERWLIAPDGDISRLPFDALPLHDGGYVFDRYTISYLTSGRDLTHPARTVRPGAPLVIADPDFDLVAAEAGGTPDIVVERAAGAARSLTRSGIRFSRMAGARAEGEEIARLMKVAPVTGASALERCVRSARSPLVLHLATHGFFLEDRPLRPDNFGPAAESADTLTAAGNPMLRSGLVLAGANTWLRGAVLPPEAEDGILTAQDVCGLDLAGTELAVLSACDTGLGTLHDGEGVFGLRRAFAIAGARTLIMSLWKVPDDETRELMLLFYRNLASGFGRLSALRLAQAVVRAAHPEAYHWASFICEGETGPIGSLEKGNIPGESFL